ncbi:5-dehydro-4-deoxy-D-glucuronate isomerase [Azospirillum picis]|uniref:4-deoxy-L-threo-5-hexosulose-uronate ketol-isomerase n=1 Tax=Azospirillum picis TaxID=488438 RepID=A0ABU0MLK6_9PROT|nr:5-dehydro-4-deoxy-D-glucuronate isomerase [Azospirillum picis]MBP2301026.1 4-deoxy-L-threo-5-hexosulose-uronate ketol-isomerase [Azospirillum picis]MDQ0534354.1 4-deoxy-L-threo-5-hexosulose-uronate ketol-isomerase [Azospirillum picis]
MKIDVRYASHPDDLRGYDTRTLRDRFLVDTLFEADQTILTYSHVDRFLVGGVMPVAGPVPLKSAKEIGTDSFLERRELGLYNVGGPGRVTVDGARFDLDPRDALYVAQGSASVQFESLDRSRPAKFYLASTPAHARFETMKISAAQAKQRPLGSRETSNERVIYQMIHPEVCRTAQLVMGMTMLKSGNMWNSMPCHTHERRSEVYFYFDLPEDARILHLMGRPEETRHIVMANEQAVISPPWSIHCGVGTHNYTFIWAMAGDNQTFDDMDAVPLSTLR